MARHSSVTQVREPSLASPSRDDFSVMLEESFITQSPAEGSVIKGTIVAIENDFAIVDVGLKTEGRVSLKEFSMPGMPVTVKVGDEVEVYLERVENALGEAVLSRDKARREESWIRLERAFNEQTRVTGVIFGRVKGGFTVDLDGAVAFLPGSQVDVRPMRDVGPLMNQPQPFQILKMDRRRGNIVVSRRAVLEERRAEERTSLVASLQEKQMVEGIVKNITDYGAFVDLGGVDGLLHVTDIAWRRVSHPTEVLSVGQTVNVQIIKINHETQRISLGMKQLQTDPWEGVGAKYPSGARFKGKVTNVTDYGAFVELEPGVEGLVHVCEMSWVKKNVAPGKIVTPGAEVEVQVLEVDSNKRRISPRPQADAGQSLAGVRGRASAGQHRGRRDQIDHRVRPVRRPRRGYRRHGASLRSVAWDKSGEQAVKPITRRARPSRPRCSTSTSRRNASAWASSSSAAIRWRRRGHAQEGRGGHRHRHGSERRRHRSAARRRRQELHPPLRSGARPRRSAPGTLRQGRQGRCAGHQHGQGGAQDRPLDQGARNLRREGSRSAIRLVGYGASLGDILGAALRRRAKRAPDDKDEDDDKEEEKDDDGKEGAADDATEDAGKKEEKNEGRE